MHSVNKHIWNTFCVYYPDDLSLLGPQSRPRFECCFRIGGGKRAESHSVLFSFIFKASFFIIDSFSFFLRTAVFPLSFKMFF